MALLVAASAYRLKNIVSARSASTPAFASLGSGRWWAASLGELWDELEYRELFDEFPVSGSPPSGSGLDRLERRLNHSRGGIVAQWDDAKSYCSDSQSTEASDGLKAYLDRMGLCRD